MPIKNEQEWLKERLNGIGASEASAIMGLSPYMSNERLWEIKTRRIIADDISDSPFVKYGKAAESHLRELFALDFPQYVVEYKDFDIVRNPDYPFIFATLDGKLLEMDNSKPMRKIVRYGILEIKTTEILQSGQWDKWDDRIPQNYYIQVLHQLLATGWDFAILKAQIKWRKGNDINLTTRHYHIERSAGDVPEDLEQLLKEEVKFWECVQEDRRPNTMLPPI